MPRILYFWVPAFAFHAFITFIFSTILLRTVVVLDPLRNPGFYPRNVAIHLLARVARQLNHDLLVVRVARLLQQHLHDLRVEVLL